MGPKAQIQRGSQALNIKFLKLVLSFYTHHIFNTGVLNKLLSDENTNKNQMDSMKVDTKRAQNQFTTKSYLLVFGRY